MRVLIVEDERISGIFARNALDRRAKDRGIEATFFIVTTVADAFVELSVTESLPDVVMLDLEVGLDNGIVILESIRSRGLLIRVVIYSGYDTQNNSQVANTLAPLKPDAILMKSGDWDAVADVIFGEQHR